MVKALKHSALTTGFWARRWGDPEEKACRQRERERDHINPSSNTQQTQTKKVKPQTDWHNTTELNQIESKKNSSVPVRGSRTDSWDISAPETQTDLINMFNKYSYIYPLIYVRTPSVNYIHPKHGYMWSETVSKYSYIYLFIYVITLSVNYIHTQETWLYRMNQTLTSLPVNNQWNQSLNQLVSQLVNQLTV